MGGRGPPGCGAPSGSGIYQRGAVGSPLGDGPRRRPGREGFPRAVRVPAGAQLRGRSPERKAVIDGLTSILAPREAAETEEDSEVRTHLYLHLGGVAVRKGFLGMGVFALEKASRGGGVAAEEAARQLSRLEKTLVSRPKIVGLVPLSGRYADMGFAVLAGAEVAIRQSRGQEADPLLPVVRWTDTGGQPERARAEFQ